MSQTPTTRRQLRERVTPTERDDRRRRGGGPEKNEDTPGGTSGVKMRTRLSTGTLIMNGTSTLREKDLRTPPSTPTSETSRAHREGSSGGLKRRAVTPSSSSESQSAAPPPKLRKLARGDGEEGSKNDYYCWLCHKEGGGVYCQLCPRSYHLKCLAITSVPKEWVCVECEKVMRAECTDTCSRAMGQINTDTLCLLLRYALNRMRQPGSEIFQKPADSDIPNYSDYIFLPMDFTVLEKNIKKKEYGCTEGFLADAKWILHNCIIFNGLHHKLTAVARNVVKSCKHEMTEIEVCPQCYEHSCVHGDTNWFIEPCEPPHTLVWAKLKGYPFWPAKALQEVDGQVDVRFFGAHDKSWIPLSQVFLLSKEPPTGVKSRKGGYGTALDEMEEHIQLIRRRYGSFDFAPYRTPYDQRHVYMNNKVKAANMMATKRFKASVYSKVAVRGKDAEKVSALWKTASALKSKYSTMANKKSAIGQGQGRSQYMGSRHPSSSSESSPEKAVRDSVERTSAAMMAKTLLLSPRVNVTDIIQQKIMKQKELAERTEGEAAGKEKRSFVVRIDSSKLAESCDSDERDESLSERTETAESDSGTDAVKKDSDRDSDKDVKQADVKEMSIVAAKEVTREGVKGARGVRTCDSGTVKIFTDNTSCGGEAVTSTKDGKAVINAVKPSAEELKMPAPQSEVSNVTSTGSVAGDQNMAAKSVSDAVKADADTTPAPSATTTSSRFKSGEGASQVADISQNVSASSEQNSTPQTASVLKPVTPTSVNNTGANLATRSIQSKVGNSSLTTAEDNAVSMSNNSRATPVSPSASSPKPVPKETVSEDTSPKTGAQYKDSLLKTIEACKGKLGITDDTEIQESMEVSDDDEDSGDNKEKRLEGEVDDTSQSDSQASSEKEVEKTPQDNNTEKQTNLKVSEKDKPDDKVDLTEEDPSGSVKVGKSASGDCGTSSSLSSAENQSNSAPSPQTVTSSREGSGVVCGAGFTSAPSAVSEISSTYVQQAGQIYATIKVTPKTPIVTKANSAEQVTHSMVSVSKCSKTAAESGPIATVLSQPTAISTKSISSPVSASPKDTPAKTVTGSFFAVSSIGPGTTTVSRESAGPVSAPSNRTAIAKARCETEVTRSGSVRPQTKTITIDDDDDDEPGLLMEVESETDHDSLIIDLDEDDLDLTDRGSKSKERSQDFERELAPSPAVIQNLQRAGRLLENTLKKSQGKSKKRHKVIGSSLQKSSSDASQSSSSSSSLVISSPPATSAPCVMIDVRSLSGLDHEWDDESAQTALPQTQEQSRSKTHIESVAQSVRTSSQQQEFRRPNTPSTEQTARTPPAASPSPTPAQGSAQRSRSGSGGTSREEDTVGAERTLTPAAISLVNKYSQQIVHNTQYQLAEMCRAILASAPDEKEHEQRLQEMQEQMQWTHEQQVAEMQHNFKMTIAEMKACWEAEKSKALSELKKSLGKAKDEAVAEAKKKQWCAHCWKEALYYCCWNTSYCSYDCQQNHWSTHQSNCRQAIDAVNTSTTDTAPTGDTPVVTTAGSVSVTDKGLSNLEDEKLKAQKFNLPNPNIAQTVSVQADDAWRNRLPLPPQTLGVGHNIHFIPAQQPQQQPPPPSQPLQQLQYLHSLGPTGPATFQTNSQVQLLTQRPAINTIMPTGAVMPGNTMVFPILRSSQSGSLPGAQNVVLNRPLHYQQMWKHC